MSTSLLEINHLDKRFITSESEVHVLKDINLTINEGEFISVIGPSGCGKSTLLRIIGGLDQNFTGDISLSGNSISQPSIDKGLIFQEPRLFPWLTVEKNIAADLSLKNADIRQKTEDLIKLVKLTGFEKSYPRELSGGMAQRVSIARALLRDPKILLLDEPFGALDAFTRAHMQEALLEIWSKNKVTMVFVTHDIDEAIFLGTKIFILKPRPGELRSIVPVDLPYPRVKTSAEFQELRSRVLNDLEGIDEVSWGEAGSGI